MKYILIISAFLALTLANSPVNVWTEKGMLNVSYEPEFPIGITLEGAYDLDDNEKTTMTAFLKILGEKIPLAHITNPDQQLTWTTEYCFGSKGTTFYFCTNLFVSLTFGWKVQQMVNL